LGVRSLTVGWGLLLLAQALAETAIYRWVDEGGTVHYSDRRPVVESAPTVSVPELDDPRDREHADQEPASMPQMPDVSDQEPPPEAAPVELTPPLLQADEQPVRDGARERTAEGGAAPQSDIVVGMTKREVIQTWGAPDYSRRSLTPLGEVQQWAYEEGPGFTQSIYFQDGRVVRVEIPDPRELLK
jgi:Domain of unknown function (DUF4124)/Protein of unknown function (DUF2845)